MNVVQTAKVPTALRDLGLRADQLEQAATLIAEAAPDVNPRPVSVRAAFDLIHAAWSGDEYTGKESQ